MTVKQGVQRILSTLQIELMSITSFEVNTSNLLNNTLTLINELEEKLFNKDEVVVKRDLNSTLLHLAENLGTMSTQYIDAIRSIQEYYLVALSLVYELISKIDSYDTIQNEPYFLHFKTIPVNRDSLVKWIGNTVDKKYDEKTESLTTKIATSEKQIDKKIEEASGRITDLNNTINSAHIANFANEIENQLIGQKQYSGFWTTVYAVGIMAVLLSIALINFMLANTFYSSLDKIYISIPLISLLITCALLFKFERKRFLEISFKISTAKALSVFITNYEGSLQKDDNKSRLILTAFDRISQIDGKNEEPGISIDTLLKLKELIK